MDQAQLRDTTAAAPAGEIHGADKGQRNIIWLVPAAGCAALAAAIVAYYPIQPGLFAAALIAYAIALWRRPWLWLMVVPATVSALDFGFWTGLSDASEPDAGILVTLAVLFYKAPPRRSDFELNRWIRIVLALSVTSYVISVVLGLLPIADVPAQSDNPYLDSMNAVRLAKGFFLPLLLLPFFAREIRGRKEGFELFAFGMLVGLALVTVAGLLERKLFVGNLDFTSDYRIVATFSSMNIGGAHIGTYLAMVLPFFAIVFWPRRRFLLSVGIAVLAPLSVLILVATFARAGYLAAAVGIIVLALLWLIGRGRDRHSTAYATVGLILAVVVCLVALVNFSQTGFMAKRFGQAFDEYAARESNWRKGLSVRDGGTRAFLLGMGLGTFPRVFAARSHDQERPSGLRLGREDGRDYLAISYRSFFYFAQRVPAQPGSSYRLEVDARADRRGQKIGVLLCENVLLYSRACDSADLVVPAPRTWTRLTATLSTDGFDKQRAFGIFGRPIELAFTAPLGTTVEIANVRMIGADGENLIANGDFSHDLRRWLFHDDSHQVWRIHDQYLAVLFEQGWLGLLSFGLLLGTAVVYAARAAIAGNPFGAMIAASLAAFTIAGIPDNLTEAPRIAMIFYLVCFAALLLPPGKRALT